MIERAPIGYLSPAHLSEADRLLARKFLAENITLIVFHAITLDLLVDLENYINDPENFYEDVRKIRGLGFSDNFCRILVDAYEQDISYVFFHEFADCSPYYEELTDHCHVFD